MMIHSIQCNILVEQSAEIKMLTIQNESPESENPMKSFCICFI